MFYSTQILAKKGPLGTIWIAAHLDRRLKRAQVFETNITDSVGACAEIGRASVFLSFLDAFSSWAGGAVLLTAPVAARRGGRACHTRPAR